MIELYRSDCAPTILGRGFIGSMIIFMIILLARHCLPRNLSIASAIALSRFFPSWLNFSTRLRPLFAHFSFPITHIRDLPCTFSKLFFHALAFPLYHFPFFANRHEVTHLSLARLTALEQRALECFNYSLGVPNEDWRAWLGVLKEGAQGAAALEPTPNAMSVLAIDVMERLEKELEVLVGGVGAGVVDVFAKGVIGDRRSQALATTAPAPVAAPAPVQSSVPFPTQPSVPQQSTVPFPTATEMELDELEMQQVEIDIDLDDGGPVPEELRRPVKVRLGKDETWSVKGEEKAQWGKDDKTWGAKDDKWGVDENTWGAKGEDKWGAKDDKMQWGVEEKKWESMEEDEWERALRAAGGDQFATARDSWLMGIVEDGDDRYAKERLARDYPRDNGRDWLPPSTEWDRAVQRPGKESKAKNASAVGS